MDKAEEGRRQLLELLGETGARPADEVIRALTWREIGVTPAKDLATVIARPDEFKDRLLAELTLTPAELAVRIGAAPDARHAYCLHTFALYLLALWQDPRAYPLVVSYLAADPLAADEQLDDIVTEDLPAILARTYNGSDLDSLKALIETADAPPFIRDAGLRGMHAMSRLGKLDRNSVVAYFEALAGSMEQPANGNFIEVFAMSMAALQEQRLRPVIDRWATGGGVDPLLLRPVDVEATYNASHDDLQEELTGRERFDGLVDYLSGWAWFNATDPAEFETSDDLEDWPQEPYMREGRKIGRNEPCPCGSGRKYKKCCLAADGG